MCALFVYTRDGVVRNVLLIWTRCDHRRKGFCTKVMNAIGEDELLGDDDHTFVCEKSQSTVHSRGLFKRQGWKMQRGLGNFEINVGVLKERLATSLAKKK